MAFNVLFSLTMIFVALYCIVIALEQLNKKQKNWKDKIRPKFFKRRQRLDEINQRYEQLRATRREVLQHYYWAQSCGEKQKEQNMEKEVERLDHQLDELREEYKLVEQGKQVPLKKI